MNTCKINSLRLIGLGLSFGFFFIAFFVVLGSDTASTETIENNIHTSTSQLPSLISGTKQQKEKKINQNQESPAEKKIISIKRKTILDRASRRVILKKIKKQQRIASKKSVAPSA